MTERGDQGVREVTSPAIADAAIQTELSDGRGVSAQMAQLMGKSGDADSILGTDSKFQLVDSKGDNGITLVQSASEMQRHIDNMLNAGRNGGDWGPAAESWKKAFQSESEVPNANAQSVFRGLNMIGAAINKRLAPELEAQNRDLKPGEEPRLTSPVGIAVLQKPEGTYFYMMNSKDAKSLSENRAAIMMDGIDPNVKLPPSVLKLGPFVQGRGI